VSVAPAPAPAPRAARHAPRAARTHAECARAHAEPSRFARSCPHALARPPRRFALRRDAAVIVHEDFVEGTVQVQAKKKSSLQYYA